MGDCGNDKAESMKICNARENTEIRIYDNGTPQLTANQEHDDDYLKITINKDMDSCLEIKSLDESHRTEYVTYKLQGNGNGHLNGDVSSLAFYRGISNNCIYL